LGIKQREDQFSEYLWKNSIRLFILHVASLAIGFLSNFIYIRLVGVQDYGSYVYIFNLIYLLAGFCIFGTDTLLIKKISVYDSPDSKGELKGVIFFSIGISIVGSVLFAFVSEKVFSITGSEKYLGSLNWFLLAPLSLVLLSLTTINQSILQGLKKFFLSQFTEKFVKPMMFLVLVLVFFYLRKKILTLELSI